MSDRTERLVRAIFKLRTPPPAGSPHYVSGWETALDAAADVVRQDAAIDAPARTALPDVLRGAADRIDAEDVPQNAQDTADFIDGARWATGRLRAIAAEADAAPGDIGWLPDWLTALAREHAASLLRDDFGKAVDALARVRRLHDALAGEDLLNSPDDKTTRGGVAKKIAAALDGWTSPADRFPASLLSEAERGMLRLALELAEEQTFSRGDEFTDDGTAALESLRRLANGPVVAYRNPSRPGVLLCREHGDGWAGLTALHAHDLPDGGTCTYGDPAAGPAHACGRDVLAPQGGDVR